MTEDQAKHEALKTFLLEVIPKNRAARLEWARALHSIASILWQMAITEPDSVPTLRAVPAARRSDPQR